MAPTLRLRLQGRDTYISKIIKRDQAGTLTAIPRPASGTQHDMAPRTRRAEASAEAPKRSIRLTVKAPPSRLQEIKGDDDEEEARPSRARSGRAKNQKQSYIEKESSADEDEDDADDDAEEDPEGDADANEDDEQDDDEDVEEEDEDADGDVEMDGAPPRITSKLKSGPTIRFAPSGTSKPARARKASPNTTIQLGSNKHRTVEAKEMDEQASQSESSEVEDDPEDLENGALDEPEDLDPDRGDTIKVDAINDSDLDSDDSNDSSLPDLSKLTRRQRGGEDDGALMALSNEAQKKKFFTPEQITMRRAEMARRRKDLSEKRNEQEKADTLRRLLHKPAPSRRSRAQVLADAEREEFGPGRGGLRGESVAGDDEEGEPEPKADRIYARTIIGREGTKVGIPSDWLEAPVGGMFAGATKRQDWSHVVRPGRMVEEVQ